MNRSSNGSVSYGWFCAASVAALTGVVAACSNDNNNPVVVGTGGTDAAAGAGGTAGTSGSGGKGGTDAAAGGTDAAAMGGAGGAGGGPVEAGVTTMVTKTELVSDQAGAAYMDPSLINAWGLAINPKAAGGPFVWVVANGSGMAKVYDKTGKAQPLSVTIPVVGDAGESGPTGQVFNDSAAFMGDVFIFSSEEGAIAGWKTGATATIRVDNSGSEAKYKGLAVIPQTGGKVLAAPDFHNGKIDVFSQGYAAVPGADMFKDATIPAGYAPFNVAYLDGNVYVTYAKQDADKEDDVKGAGFGYVDTFKPDGTGMKRLISQGALNAPWGMAIAPSSYGSLSGTLLVGNFGDGKINAYDKTTGELKGALADSTGKPIAIDGLWALEVGPATTTALQAANADLSQTVFFTAGPGKEKHGLFGTLTAGQADAGAGGSSGAGGTAAGGGSGAGGAP